MASEEDRISARKRIEIHRRNLRELEERAASYAGDVPIHIKNQIDQERVNIASLEPIANPLAAGDTQRFVARVSDSNGGNWDMLMSQFRLLNERMTKQEGQNKQILDEQGMARIWRLQAGSDIDDLKADNADRVPRQRHNFWLLIAVVVMLVLVLFVLLLYAVFLR